MENVVAYLTGIPQFVLIPAPVTTITFFDFPNVSATSCMCRSAPGRTLIVGMAPLADAINGGSLEEIKDIRAALLSRRVARELEMVEMFTARTKRPLASAFPLSNALEC
jgi:hypothetical protein